jgi:hypothetical protein
MGIRLIRAMQWFGILVLVSTSSSAGDRFSLEIRSTHEKAKVQVASEIQDYVYLSPDGILVFEISSSNHVGVRFRALVNAFDLLVPVYVTVIRDDEEQGTIRLGLPAIDESATWLERKQASLSKEVLLKIAVPPGRHSYQVLFNGPNGGVIVQAFVNTELLKSAIEATPGTRMPEELEKRPSPHRQTNLPRISAVEKKRFPLLSSQEWLGSVTTAAEGPNTGRWLESKAQARRRHLNAWTRISYTVAGALFLGGVSLAISGTAHNHATYSAQNLFSQEEMVGRSQRTFRAAGIFFSLSAVSAMVGMTLFGLDEPLSESSHDPHP